MRQTPIFPSGGIVTSASHVASVLQLPHHGVQYQQCHGQRAVGELNELNRKHLEQRLVQ